MKVTNQNFYSIVENLNKIHEITDMSIIRENLKRVGYKIYKSTTFKKAISVELDIKPSLVYSYFKENKGNKIPFLTLLRFSDFFNIPIENFEREFYNDNRGE